MSDLTARFMAACRPAGEDAATRGFPPFTTGLRTETPLNSAPYLFDLPGLRALFASDDARVRMIDACEEVLEELAAQGVVWRMLLVGGSFLRDASEPSDLDAMVVYTIDPTRIAAAQAMLRDLAPLLRDRPLDLGFCPADAGPIILVKRAIFFSNLFGYDRDRDALVHGTVMVVPQGDR